MQSTIRKLYFNLRNIFHDVMQYLFCCLACGAGVWVVRTITCIIGGYVEEQITYETTALNILTVLHTIFLLNQLLIAKRLKKIAKIS